MIDGRPERPRRQLLPRRQRPGMLPLVGDGLLPAGHRRQAEAEERRRHAPIVGTQDDGGGYGATFDALNIWELRREVALDADGVARPEGPAAGRRVRLDLPVRADRPRLPAAAGHHRPEPVPRHPVLPAAADLAAGLPQLQDLRGAGDQPVGRGRARHRRRALVRDPAQRGGAYSVYQQGTYAPADGVHRWMGSIAQDKKGNMALGYSVVNGTTSSRASATPAGWPATRSGR